METGKSKKRANRDPNEEEKRPRVSVDVQDDKNPNTWKEFNFFKLYTKFLHEGVPPELSTLIEQGSITLLLRPSVVSQIRQACASFLPDDRVQRHGALFKGPAGSGKSTALALLAYTLRNNNWLVLYIPRAKDIISGTRVLNKIVSEILFAHAEANETLLRNLKPRSQPGVESLYDLVLLGTTKDSDAVKVLEDYVDELKTIKTVPVAVCIDQWNAFFSMGLLLSSPEGNPERVRPEQNRVCRLFKDFNNFKLFNGSYFVAMSSSFRPHNKLDDGNSVLIQSMTAYDDKELTLLLQKHGVSLDIKDEVRQLTGALPREVNRLIQLLQNNANDLTTKVANQYKGEALPYFETRILAILEKDKYQHPDPIQAEKEHRENVEFAARVYSGVDLTTLPGMWEASGLVERDDARGLFRFTCPPAREAVIRTLADSKVMDSAIATLAADPSTRWRAFELAVVNLFLPSAGKERFCKIHWTQRGTSSETPVRIHGIAPNPPLTKPFRLLDGYIYVCDRGQAVVDLVFHYQSELYLVQISEQAYHQHAKKIPDLYTQMVGSSNLSVINFFLKCIGAGEHRGKVEPGHLPPHVHYFYFTNTLVEPVTDRSQYFSHDVKEVRMPQLKLMSGHASLLEK